MSDRSFIELVDGARFEVARAPSGAPGSEARPLVVFLHEGLGSALHWRDFPARCAVRTGLDAVAYSRLGYGRSDPVPLPRPLDYMQEDARTWVPRVLERLAGPAGPNARRYVLFGHSDGASIALLHAADAAARERVAAVVVEAPHVFVEDVSIRSIAAAREAYRSTDLRAKLARYHGDNVDVAFRGWNDAWLDPRFRAWNIEDALARITAPILAIQGEDDAYGTRAQVDAIARRSGGPVEIALLPKCGHSPHKDAPEVVLDEVSGWLARLST